MRRLCGPAVLLILAICTARSAAQGGAQGVFRVGVDLVRLDVAATIGGRPVTGLGARDFEVFDNGVLQRVSVATTGGQVALALVLDTSGSVEGEPLENLVAASQSLVSALGPGDTVSLVTFSSRLSLEAGAVRDPAVVRRALGNARSAGRTALWDALLAGTSLVAGRTERSLVLAFTDGTDNSSWLRRDQLEEALKRSEAVVYAVQSGNWGAPDYGNQKLGARRALQSVVNQTGGDVLQAESGAKLSQQFKTILDTFRAGYLVTYEPTGVRRDDGWHRVEVRVKGRSAKVVTRAGYYANGSRPE